MQQFDPLVLARAKNGEEAAIAALIARMMPAIRKGAAATMAPGLDYDDAVQEGLIGLFSAIRSYDADKGSPFAGYAAVCIANAQQDACRRARRKKHTPLNESVPLDDGEEDGTPTARTALDPETITIAGEEYAEVMLRMETALSRLERRTLLLCMAGKTPAEAAGQLGCTPKAAQNALARARRKLKQ